MEKDQLKIELKLTTKLAASRIPPHMHDGLVQYIVVGRPTGSFLTAIFSNDLKEACNRADAENQYLLYDYVFFLYNNAPSQCWGSEERHKAWLEIGGLTGLLQAAANKVAEDQKAAQESTEEKA